MKIFDFDPADHADTFAHQGWVHIERGIAPEFLAHLKEVIADRLREAHVEGSSIGGTKEQALFEFPPGARYPEELYDTVADLCGLDRAGMTLSERHIKSYDPDSPPELVPHKDRYASQVSVGLSVNIPEGSRLLLYPHDHVSVNPFNVSWEFKDSLQPHEHPEVALRHAEAVELWDHDGDVVVFHGNAIWHCRRNSADATNIYLKFNDFGSDPLGEDPQTPARRRATEEALSNGHLTDTRPAVSRQLDTITHRFSPQDWTDLYQACVFDRTPIILNETQFRIVRAVDGSQSVADLTTALSNGVPASRIEEEVRRLAEQGVLDLM